MPRITIPKMIALLVASLSCSMSAAKGEGVITANLLTNPGAEAGGLSGWTAAGPGTPQVDNGSFDPGINPHTGTFDFVGYNGSSDSLSQTVSILVSGITPALVDSGQLLANLSFWEQGLNQGDPSDDAAVQLTFLDGSSVVIGSVNSPIIDSHNLAWQNYTNSYAIPAGTRSITYTMQFFRNVGDYLDAFVDDNSLTISGPATQPLRFISMLPPCRVVDTRDATKPFGFGPPFISGETSRSFAIPNGPCGVPASAQAYSLNVTVVPYGELGYLTVWPTGQSQPLASTLNSLDGEVKASAAIVPAGTGGAISVFATNGTDVVLDINGYFVPATDSNVAFYPMTPCRLVDTRPGAPSTITSGALTGGISRTLPILSSSCDVPAAAVAYSLNFTLVPPEPVAYLTVYPTGESRPIVSTLNDPTGTVEANAAIAPAGTDGSIDVYVTDATDLVVDINGYFAPVVGEGGLSLYTLPTCRVLDTRNPTGSPPFAGAINVDVLGGGCGGTSAAQAYVFNATVVPEGFLGYLTLWPEGSAQPVVSTLNAYDGDITSNMAIVPTTNTEISAYASNYTYLILDISGYFAP